MKISEFGRLLDSQVATYVFGWHNVVYDEIGIVEGYPEGSTELTEVPYYSDPELFEWFKIVEVMRERDYNFHLYWESQCIPGAYFRFWGSDEYQEMFASNVSEVVCRAAVDAMIKNVGRSEREQ